MKRDARTILVALVLVAVALGCEAVPGESEESKEAFKARMLEIEKRIKDSMPKTQEIALKQKAEKQTVREVQEKLAVLREYLDEPSGKIDFVTVNAIQAFERNVGLVDDGLLDEETLKRLDEAVEKVRAGDEEYFQKGYYAG